MCPIRFPLRCLEFHPGFCGTVLYTTREVGVGRSRSRSTVPDPQFVSHAVFWGDCFGCVRSDAVPVSCWVGFRRRRGCLHRFCDDHRRFGGRATSTSVWPGFTFFLFVGFGGFPSLFFFFFFVPIAFSPTPPHSREMRLNTWQLLGIDKDHAIHVSSSSFVPLSSLQDQSRLIRSVTDPHAPPPPKERNQNHTKNIRQFVIRSCRTQASDILFTIVFRFIPFTIVVVPLSAVQIVVPVWALQLWGPHAKRPAQRREARTLPSTCSTLLHVHISMSIYPCIGCFRQ